MSLQVFNSTYDYLTSSATFTSRGKPVLLILSQQEYLGCNVVNFTKWQFKGGDGTFRYFYKNVPALGNSALFESQVLANSASTQTQNLISGIAEGMFVLPGTPSNTITVSNISKGAVAEATYSTGSPSVGSFLRVDSIAGMPQLQGAIVKVTGVTASTFTMTVNSGDFPTVATGAKMVETPLLHTWKIISAIAGVTTQLTLSNVDGIVAGSILTLSTGGSELSELTNRRATVLNVDEGKWTVTVDLDTSRILNAGTTLLTASTGIVPSVVGLQSVQPDPNITEAGPLETYPVLNNGGARPAGEANDLIRVDLFVDGLR